MSPRQVPGPIPCPAPALPAPWGRTLPAAVAAGSLRGRDAVAGGLRLGALLLWALLGLCLWAFANAPARAEAGKYVSTAGVALAGHDPVSYFQDGGPRPGDAEHALKWRGVMWYFATEANLSRFEMDPAAFVPQFGGYCPVSLAKGHPQPGNPRIYVIRDGKLYLLRAQIDRAALALDGEAILTRAGQAWKARKGY